MNRRDVLKLAGLALALPAASVVHANEPFQIIEPAQKAEKKTCPQCGAPVSEDALFCNKCGAQL